MLKGRPALRAIQQQGQNASIEYAPLGVHQQMWIGEYRPPKSTAGPGGLGNPCGDVPGRTATAVHYRPEVFEMRYAFHLRLTKLEGSAVSRRDVGANNYKLSLRCTDGQAESRRHLVNTAQCCARSRPSRSE